MVWSTYSGWQATVMGMGRDTATGKAGFEVNPRETASSGFGTIPGRQGPRTTKCDPSALLAGDLTSIVVQRRVPRFEFGGLAVLGVVKFRAVFSAIFGFAQVDHCSGSMKTDTGFSPLCSPSCVSPSLGLVAQFSCGDQKYSRSKLPHTPRSPWRPMPMYPSISSLTRFFRLPRLGFKLIGAEVAQCEMASVAVIQHFNVLNHGGLGLLYVRQLRSCVHSRFRVPKTRSPTAWSQQFPLRLMRHWNP